MEFVEYGDSAGKTVVYFHGAPGSPEECSVFDHHAKQRGLHIICFDRFAVDSSIHGTDYYKYLADAIIKKSNGTQVDLIGFSIGCHAAIETSLHLAANVGSLHLISAAAPLDADDFLSGMAGEMVFKIAMKYPTIFTLLSYWQALLAKLAPTALFKMLFASAAGEDKTLSNTQKFQDYISPVLTHCFTKNVKGYIREINQYVLPWKKSVSQCPVDTFIWHGESDNWSPVSMAHYLKQSMPASSHLEVMPSLSHYTCLYAAAPKICALLAKQ